MDGPPPLFWTSSALFCSLFGLFAPPHGIYSITIRFVFPPSVLLLPPFSFCSWSSSPPHSDLPVAFFAGTDPPPSTEARSSQKLRPFLPFHYFRSKLFFFSVMPHRLVHPPPHPSVSLLVCFVAFRGTDCSPAVPGLYFAGGPRFCARSTTKLFASFLAFFGGGPQSRPGSQPLPRLSRSPPKILQLFR